MVRNRLVESIPVHLCDKVVCISLGNLYQYQIRFSKLMDKLILIPNLFDLNEIPDKETYNKIRSIYGWRNDQIHVVSVGRIATQKHLEWLLESWVIVQKEVPEARLWIVGSGEEEKRMHELAKKLEITSTCTFLGAQPNGINFICASDIVAMTSLYEGHANIPMEAQLCSKPIVANSVDGVRETITDGVDGFLVPTGDIKIFSARLVTLCSSPSMREKMGNEGKIKINQFVADDVLNQYSNLINQYI